jgi:demethylmenaquinone methyltransferase/2-methoxy-6-polyprenyl-1,4-benzoquinol methylase
MSKQEAKANYDRLSRWYDLFVRFERKYKEAGLRKLDARGGETVLEVGFGTGRCIVDLAQAVGDRGRVYGIDISEGMCSVAQAKVKKAGLSQKVSLHCGDAARLPFEAGIFDAIFMSFVLELFHAPEIPTVLGECHRVLKDDGRICVVSMSQASKHATMLGLYEWFHRKFPKYVDCRPILAPKILEQAGFYIKDAIEMSMWGLPVEIVLAKK